MTSMLRGTKKTDATDDAGAGMKSSVDVKLGRVIETRSRAMAVAETEAKDEGRSISPTSRRRIGAG